VDSSLFFIRIYVSLACVELFCFVRLTLTKEDPIKVQTIAALGILSHENYFRFCTFARPHPFLAKPVALVMSDIKKAGFQTGDILAQLNNALQSFGNEEKKGLQRKTNTIFELQIKNKEGAEATWTIDVKNEPKVHTGPGNAKPGVTLIMTDETFQALAEGKLDGQKAFMTGKLKTKGNMMLAMKLDGVLKAAKAKAKL